MRPYLLMTSICAVVMSFLPSAFGRQGTAGELQRQTETTPDPAKILVDRLDLDRYKATIKGLTQFGDRKQGTDRNRHAIDWIETQLKSYGCPNIERLKYNYQSPSPDTRNTMVNTAGGPATPTPPNATSVGGGHPGGLRVRTGVNNDPNAQPDPKLRALDSPPSVPGAR